MPDYAECRPDIDHGKVVAGYAGEAAGADAQRPLRRFLPRRIDADPFCDLPDRAPNRLIEETLNWLGEFPRAREPRVRHQGPG